VVVTDPSISVSTNQVYSNISCGYSVFTDVQSFGIYEYYLSRNRLFHDFEYPDTDSSLIDEQLRYIGMEPLLTILLLTTLVMFVLGYAAMVLSVAIDRQKTRQLVAIKALTTRLRNEG
jgi:hypothetical protein